MNFIEYIKEELQEISMMEYSTEYSDEAKNISVGSNNILDSETHSKMSEIDFAGNFSDKETLIKWYFSYLSNMKKLGAVSQLGQFIKDNDVKSVISFGAGPCVLEYFASLITGGGTGHPIKLVATDYDTYIIENAKRVLEHDDFLIEKFDFYTDDVTEIANRHSSDMAVMFGSSCSLNDEKYISFLKDLKKTNVKYVLTFEAGVSDNYTYFKRCMITLLSAVKTYLTKNEKRKKVAIHAFARSDRKLLKIFKTADIKYHEIKSDIYRKVYVLEL